MTETRRRPVESVSAAGARRIALAAQGFARKRPHSVGARHLASAIRRMGLVQIDSVNVFERSHYLPLFARLGAYDKTELDRITLRKNSPFIEYWAHEAAFIPLETRPLWRWKMDETRERDRTSSAWVAANHDMLNWLRAELASTGPVPASAIRHDSNQRSGAWWGWSEVKIGLEYLFEWGEVVTAGRTRFERNYALADDVLPAPILEIEVPKADAIRELMSIATHAHGIGTLTDFADYFRLKSGPAKTALHELEEIGEISPVTVPGWNRPAWLHRSAHHARKIEATALLSPFDPIVWERKRAHRMFDFHYRIEIYTPAHKRRYGYYSLPVLLDDRIVGRVDLKSDRKPGILRVQSAWSEPDAPAETAERIAGVIREAAEWQGLSEIAVVDRGDLARSLAGALGVGPISPD